MKSWKQIALCSVIIIAAAGGWYAYKQKSTGENVAAVAPGASPPRVARAASTPLVVVEPVSNETINSRLTAIGTGRALSTVLVTPYSSGNMTALLVEPGATVTAGQPIASLDSETQQIALKKAEAALKDAQITLDRIARLRQTNTVTQVQEVAAELAVSNTRLAVEDAQLALDRRTVRAPIAGVVGILPVNAGNYITTDTAIARIDDRSKILVDLWVPERFAPQVAIGQVVTAQLTALPGQNIQGRIVALDNMLDETSRTLRLRAEFENPGDRLRAGMSFSVTMRFPGDTYPSVDPLAIQWGSEGSYVWRVVDDVAHRVNARIVQRNSASVLVDAPLKEGDTIVTEGVQTVREGAAVQIKGQSSSAVPLARADTGQAG